MSARLGGTAARAGLVAFSLLSGTYALLAHIPFTYQAVVKFPMVSWMPAFVRLHPYLLLGLVLVNLGLDRKRWLGPGASPAMRAFGGSALAFALYALVRPPMPGIHDDATSLVWAVAFLALPLWLLVLDGCRAWEGATWKGGPSDEARRLFLAAICSGLVASLLFPALAWIRLGPPDPRPGPEALALVWGWSLCAHLLVFLAAAVLLMGVLGLARMFPWPWMEPALLALSFLAALAWFFRAVVFKPIAFQGPPALLMGALVGALAVAFLASVAPSEPGEAGQENALDLLLRPLIRLLRGHPFRAMGLLALVSAGAGLALARAAVFDWNFLFQKVIVVGAAVLLFASLYAAIGIRPARVVWVWAVILVPVVTMNVFLAFDEDLAVRSTLKRADRRLGPLLDQQAGRDVSVRLLREALSPLQQVQRSIYRALQKNSNIPHDVRTDPVDVQHVEQLQPAPGPKPDIFIFVVDSLRRDYLGAYNPKVQFTPELDRFAAESVVLPNAFTRYGATGLSEPSIWTGALMLHKQYIRPFHPMNSLQKLLEVDGYEGLVSMDTIMDVVVKPGPWLRSLDPGVDTQDLRLESSLQKLEAALQNRGAGARPLFAYSQCQDIHISVVNREGQTTVTPGDYRGFYAPYASRLHRLDAAFGRFIAFLKRQGRYEDSLIVFTADHGDSLGEEGRFGHAYTLFPEIVRIPLLIHLPASMRKGLLPGTESPAFLTDLTPTLYYLLGHRPIKVDRALGRPLFTVSPQEQTPYRQDHYLLASSYGAVFGILDGSGRSLYIADGVNFTDYLYRLDEGLAGVQRPFSSEQKAHYDQLILEDLDLVNRFYHFKPDP
jgi:Sulfatase